LNITHIITGLETGGAEHSLLNLLSCGLEKEHMNRVVSLGETGPVGRRIQELGVSVTSLGMGRGRPTVSGLRTLKETIQDSPADIIQGWIYHGNLATLFARKYSKNKPTIFWNIRQSLYNITEEKWLTRQVIRLHRRFSNTPHGIIYNSTVSKEHHEKYGIVNPNSIVIPNGIDTEKFIFSAETRTEMRSKLDIPNDVFVVGHVARFHHMKDHTTFLKAADLVLEQYPNTHFLLCGLNVTNENNEFLKEMSQRVRSKAIFLGERGDVQNVMTAIDVFCQSSRSEAFPNVLCEAMSTSIPCVATSVGDSELIVDSSGILVPPQDQSSLASGLIELLSLSKKERQDLGQRARDRIVENFNLKSSLNNYSNLYADSNPAVRAN